MIAMYVLIERGVVLRSGRLRSAPRAPARGAPPAGVYHGRAS
jgi:hypothetical protein